MRLKVSLHLDPRHGRGGMMSVQFGRFIKAMWAAAAEDGHELICRDHEPAPLAIVQDTEFMRRPTPGSRAWFHDPDVPDNVPYFLIDNLDGPNLGEIARAKLLSDNPPLAVWKYAVYSDPHEY